MANRLDRGWQTPAFPQHLECEFMRLGAVQQNPSWTATSGRTNSPNVRVQSHPRSQAKSESLDKVGASMYGNETLQRHAPPSRARRPRKARKARGAAAS